MNSTTFDLSNSSKNYITGLIFVLEVLFIGIHIQMVRNFCTVMFRDLLYRNFEGYTSDYCKYYNYCKHKSGMYFVLPYSELGQYFAF